METNEPSCTVYGIPNESAPTVGRSMGIVT